MLKEAHKHRQKASFRKKLFHINLVSHCLESIRCNHCGSFVAPFKASTAYLNIDIPNYRFGNHFLVGGHHDYENLVLNSEDEIFNNEEPFLLMYLQLVHCRECWAVLGLFFRTCNTLGTEWLLDRIVLNMDKLRLGGNSSSMDRTIDHLFKLLTNVEMEKLDHPVSYRRMKKKQEEREAKEKSIELEKQIQSTILDNTNPILPENKAKGTLLRRILPNLTFFDRMTERLEVQSKKII